MASYQSFNRMRETIRSIVLQTFSPILYLRVLGLYIFLFSYKYCDVDKQPGRTNGHILWSFFSSKLNIQFEVMSGRKKHV